MSLERARIAYIVSHGKKLVSVTDTIGSTATHSTGTGYYIAGYAIVASKSGIVRTLGINLLTAAGNIRLALYSTYSNLKFSGLLGQSASTAAVAGWNDLTVTGITVVASTTYYICFQLSSLLADRYYANSGTQYYCAFAYDAFPDPTPSLTSNVATGNMRMVTTYFA